MKNRPFQRAVGWFFFVNIWIIMAWSDTKFGATFSCRALVESYPLLALPLAAGIERLRFRWIWAIIGCFLIYLNGFQIWQYNTTILHFRDMNGPYYRAIFLKKKPTPLDMSLLDTHERLEKTSDFSEKMIFQNDSIYLLNAEKTPKNVVFSGKLADFIPNFYKNKQNWLRLRAEIKSEWGAFDTFFKTTLTGNNNEKTTACRMENGLSKLSNWNVIEYDFQIPEKIDSAFLRIELSTNSNQKIEVRQVNIRAYER
jgi:hypothetical protein